MISKISHDETTSVGRKGNDNSKILSTIPTGKDNAYLCTYMVLMKESATSYQIHKMKI